MTEEGVGTVVSQNLMRTEVMRSRLEVRRGSRPGGRGEQSRSPERRVSGLQTEPTHCRRKSTQSPLCQMPLIWWLFSELSIHTNPYNNSFHLNSLKSDTFSLQQTNPTQTNAKDMLSKAFHDIVSLTLSTSLQVCYNYHQHRIWR